VKTRLLLLAFAAALAAAPLAGAADWTQFRGPNGTGVAVDARNLPTRFGPATNVVWKTPLPPGHSSPVLGHDRIFVTAFEGELLVTLALEQSSGRIAWRREIARSRAGRLQGPNTPASPSPVTDGTNVYVFFQDFGLVSYGPEGVERWRLPLGPFNAFYGMGASPILVDGSVVLACDQDTGSFLLAVDSKTGRPQWRTERPEVISGYSTPVVYRPPSGAEIVIPESFQLSAYSAMTGRRVWFVRGLACEMKSIASLANGMLYVNGWGFPENQPGRQVRLQPFREALAAHDADRNGTITRSELPEGRLRSYFEAFDLDRNGVLDEREWEATRAMLGAENGLLAIRLGGRGDATATNVVWRYQKPVPQVPSTLLYRGVLYMVNDSGILVAFDPATGDVLRQGRLRGGIDKYFASPVAGDGKVFLISQAGNVSVVRAGGEWEVVATNDLDDECYATPALDGGRIYVRTRGALYCFAEGAP
jgi:outer membrane protein assembly factor BamB